MKRIHRALDVWRLHCSLLLCCWLTISHISQLSRVHLFVNVHSMHCHAPGVPLLLSFLRADLDTWPASRDTNDTDEAAEGAGATTAAEEAEEADEPFKGEDEGGPLKYALDAAGGAVDHCRGAKQAAEPAEQSRVRGRERSQLKSVLRSHACCTALASSPLAALRLMLRLTMMRSNVRLLGRCASLRCSGFLLFCSPVSLRLVST